MQTMRQRQRMRIPVIPREEWDAYRQKLEEEYPGYLAENERLTEIVKILTGLRVLYGVFNIALFWMYDLSVVQGILMLCSTLFFYGWYMWMLQSGRLVAVFMLAVRGYSIISGGASLLAMAPWLPYPLIFMLTAACIMEFTEAVFCIYTLFHPRAAQAIRLNRGAVQKLDREVASARLKEMAVYENPYQENTPAEGGENPDLSGDSEAKPAEEAENMGNEAGCK